MGYRCLHVASGKVYIARHIILNEQVSPFKLMVNSGSISASLALTLPNNLRISHDAVHSSVPHTLFLQQPKLHCNLLHLQLTFQLLQFSLLILPNNLLHLWLLLNLIIYLPRVSHLMFLLLAYTQWSPDLAIIFTDLNSTPMALPGTHSPMPWLPASIMQTLRLRVSPLLLNFQLGAKLCLRVHCTYQEWNLVLGSFIFFNEYCWL